MDTILLKPYGVVNETWIAYDLGNGDYLEAKVENTNVETFLGIQDEVKYIRFFAKDAIGNAITTHPLHLYSIQISKHYGVKRGLNFFNFPNDTSQVNLIGQNSLNTPMRHINRQDIYDFQIGDEFHVWERTIDFMSFIDERFEKRVVLNHQVNNGNISVTYDIEQIRLYTTMPPAYDTTYTRDTIIRNYLTSNNFDDLDSLPYSFDVNYQASRGALSLEDHEGKRYGNRVMKKYDFAAGYDVDTCVMELIDGFVLPGFYIEGLGDPYRNNFTFNSDSWLRELVYYKKGNEIWGDSIDIQALMPTSTRQLDIQTLSLQPNPVKDFVLINLNDEIITDAHIEVINANGQLVHHEQVDYLQNTYQVDVQNLINGFYIIRIWSGQRTWVGKFLK